MDEELGRDEVEARGEREEARVERVLGLGGLERLAVLEVRVGEDAAEAAGEGGEVLDGGRGNGDAGGEGARGVEEGGGAVEDVEDVVDCAALLGGRWEVGLVRERAFFFLETAPRRRRRCRGRSRGRAPRRLSSQDTSSGNILVEAT